MDMNVMDGEGNTALHFACSSSGCKMLKNVTDLAEVIEQIPSLYTEPFEICRFLIEMGADVNAANKYGYTALHYTRDLDCCKLLVEHDANVNALNTFGSTPLLCAKSDDISEYLIENGANINVTSRERASLLHSVTSLNLCRMLIEKGADVNFTDPNSGKAPLHCVTSGDICKLLIENGADVNAKDGRGLTPLICAPSVEICEILIANGADIQLYSKCEKRTLLHLTTSFEICKLLIENGADVNATDVTGKTPLFYTQSVKIATLFIENGAKVNHTDNRRQTPLHFATNTQICKILIDAGAEIDAVDNNLKTPLFCVKTQEIAKILLDNGAEINHVDKDGNSPLHFVETPKLCQFFIDNGADINALNSRYESPLYLACKRVGTHQDVIHIMLLSGADAKLETKLGEKALFAYSANIPLISEILFYYTYDHHIQEPVRYLDLRWAFKNLPFETAKQILDICSKLIFTKYTPMDKEIGNLMAYDPVFLKLLLEKFGNVFVKRFDDTTQKEGYFSDCQPDVSQTEAIFSLLEDFGLIQSVLKFYEERFEYYIVQWIDPTKVPGFKPDKNFRHGPEVDEKKAGFVLYLVSHGFEPAIKHLANLYSLYGHCELFRILLQCTFTIYDHRTIPPLMRLMYDVTLPLDKCFYKPDIYFYMRPGFNTGKREVDDLLQLFDYFALPCLKRFALTKYDFLNPEHHKRIQHRIKQLPCIPTLVEFARNSLRYHIVNKFKMETYSQFYSYVNKRLDICHLHKDILTFKHKLYY